MAEVRHLLVGAGEAGVRLDRFLRRRWPGLSQARIHKLARTGQLRVDGARAKAETRLAAGAEVRVPPMAEADAASLPPALSSAEADFARSLVLWQDEDILILNKPAGLATQGGAKTPRHIDRLLGVWGEGERRPRLVHRLDRDTSGVLAVARSAAAAGPLAAAFADRRVRKTYWALVAGVPRPERGHIDLPLVRQGRVGKERMAATTAADAGGQTAVTDFAVLQAVGEEAAWLALRPHTGRTHQLRAHLLAIGHPILGDPKYNTPNSRDLADILRLQLHARRLVLPRPGGGDLDVSAPPSPEMLAGFRRFGIEAADPPPDPFDA